MAKKTTPGETPESKTGLVIFQNTDKLIDDAKRELMVNTIGTPAALTKMLKQFNDLSIAGIEDMASYKVVEQAAKDLKKLRVGVDKYRVDLTAPALKWQRELKSYSDEIIGQIEPVEKMLLTKKAAIDDAKKAHEQKLFTERCGTLATNGFQLAGQFYICGALQIHIDSIIKLTDDELAFYQNEGQKELKRAEAEKQRERELAERERELAERERKLAERERELNAKETEINVQTSALNEVYETQPIVDKSEKKQPQIDQSISPTNDVEMYIDGTLKGQEPAQNDAFGEPLVDPVFIHGFRQGFEQLRESTVNHIQTSEKITRSNLVEWLKSQKYVVE